MPPSITNNSSLVEIVQAGMEVPGLAALAAAVAGGAVLTQVRARPHFWKAAREVGHFDHIDEGCVEILNEIAAQNGLPLWDDAQVAHVDADFTPAFKEEVRQLVCAHIIKDKPLAMRFILKRMIRKARMEVSDGAVLFVTPAARG